MNDDNQQTLTPRLRFPEFRDAPTARTKSFGKQSAAHDWRMVELGEIAEIKLGKMLDREKHTTGRLLPYLNNIALRWNEVDTSNLPQMYFDDDELDRFDLKAGDVVVCEGGEPGRSAVWDGRLPDLKFQKAIHRVRFKVPFEQRLLVLYLEAIAGTTAFESLFTGAGIRHLTRETFARLKIPYPSRAEQRKIAECLGSLDELIAAEGRKLEALRAHKKGLMQHLFPRESETRPRLRFPEFREMGEWEERKLGDFISERSEMANADIPLYSLTIDAGVTAKTERYERSFLVTDASDAYKVVQPNDFAFNPMNLRFGAIARHSGQHPVSLSKYYNIFSCDRSVDSQFCHVYFRSDLMVALYDRIATGSLIEKRRVHFDRFLKLDIRFPKFAEQQRIAACLSSLDAVLAGQSQKLAALRTHKQALMQQLFPSGEPSGESIG